MAYYETYLYAWCFYLLACVGFYWCVAKLSQYWQNEDVKYYLRMFTAVVLFTPALHEMDGIEALAPAFIVFFGELLTYGFEEALQGLIPLLLALFFGSLMLMLQAFIKRNKLKAAAKAVSEHG